MDAKFKLLRKIENRRFIYDSKHPEHSKREVLSSAWEEIATGIKLNGKEVTGDWCKKQWKVLRDYYIKIKKAKKGKSGQAATKPWVYFVAVDRLLSSCEEGNYSTTSKMDEVDSEAGAMSDVHSPSSSISNDDGCEETNQTPSSRKEQTPAGTEEPKVVNTQTRKRKLEDDEVKNKFRKILEEPEELRDVSYHFGMTTAANLRRLPARDQDYAMKNITDILYDLLRKHS